MTHTTVKNVEDYLNLETPFGVDTVPNLSAVENWIDEVDSKLDEATEHRYNSEDQEDIIDYNGQRYLLTKKAPIKDVTVSFNNAKTGEAPSWDVLEEFKHYSVEEEKGRIYLILEIKDYNYGKNRFKVEYKGGIETTPSWLQNLATRMVVQQVISASLNSRATSEDGSQIRIGAVQVITPSDFGVGNYRALVEGINKDLEGLENMTGVVRYVNY